MRFMGNIGLRSMGAALVVGLVATTNNIATAQYGVSSASLSMGRAGLVPDSDAILVEEYFNFHRHQISPPRKNRAIGFDVRWSTQQATAGATDLVLQIGLATQQIVDHRKVPPLNIALVIDRSGSMSGDRIENVKKSILAFVDKLRDNDTISIVGFNHEAHVVLEAEEVTDPERIAGVIESLSAGGSTDIHEGLMLGYRQVAAHYAPKKTNRVILLTDGRTNSGVQDPEEIIRQSLEYNQQGIDLSTIGLGHDLNHRLLRQLAKAGRGLIHFVDNPKDIQKIFIDELESLLSPVARDVVVELQYDDSVELIRLFGYEPRMGKHKLTVPLDDLNHGSSQVILAQFALSGELKSPAEIPVTARVKYLDLRTGKNRTHEKTAALEVTNAKQESRWDPEVEKNYTIALLAQSIKDMAVAYEKRNFGTAKEILDKQICVAGERFPKCQDKDILRVVKIAENYSKSLDTDLQQRQASVR